ncbi:MAG: CRTAC1 family protein [Phycisphaerales bacterium]
MSVVAFACLGCDPSDSGPGSARDDEGGVPAELTPSSRPVPSTGSLYTDITADAGLDFVHRCGHVSRHVLPEILGGGGAVFDYDGDGDLDLYLVNSGDHLPATGRPITATNRLYRQEPDGRFTDATDRSGLGDAGYGMGCAVGDIDNDGDLDVYVTNWGPDVLYRNNGDGTFTDITAEAGIGNSNWSMSAAFLDFDRDGFLDLFVTNYVRLDPKRLCTDDAGRPEYCSPEVFPGISDVLYRNDGGSHFTDASVSSGIATARYAGLGVVCADLDDDGWIDIYVANDGDPNNLWSNQHDGTFIDVAVLRGAAYNGHGQAEAGMGVAAGDADSDGDLDLFVTHLYGETSTYYRNLGPPGFDDVTSSVGLGVASAGYTGFGTALFDFDNDGLLDIAVVNGAVARRDIVLADQPPFWNEYVEPNFLFRNDGAGVFRDVSAQAGSFATELGVSRGLIPADLDRDGDLDLLVIDIEAPARLYRNNLPPDASAWLAIQVIIPEFRREALGARITVVLDGHRIVRHAIPPGGYLTSGEATVHVGLGGAERVERIEVRWPNGQQEVFPGCPARQVIQLRRGSGQSSG